MPNRTIEIAVGAFMLAGVLALAFLAFQVSGFSSERVKTYTVSARFKDVSGLNLQARVTMAGVTIGRVSAVRVDTARGQALVEMELDANAGAISSDAGARIVTEGVLGSKYVAISAGAESESLKDGDEIVDTQGSLILEDLIGQFVKSLGS